MNEGKQLHVILPLAPTLNHAYFSTRFGGRALKKHGREWMETSKKILEQAALEQGWECVDGEKVCVDILTVFPDRRRRDVNNTGKLLLDAPQDIVYKDDKVALPRFINFMVDKENPRSEIVFRMFDEKKDRWKYKPYKPPETKRKRVKKE